jgi:hypothetical protein
MDLGSLLMKVIMIYYIFKFEFIIGNLKLVEGLYLIYRPFKKGLIGY